MTWYRVWLNCIEPVEVVSTTEHTIKTKSGRRRLKHCESWHHFRTWEEAREYLVERAMGRVKSLRNDLYAAEQKVVELTKLKQP